MKYCLFAGVIAILTGCQNFSINNPNPYSEYNFRYSECCYEGNLPRP